MKPYIYAAAIASALSVPVNAASTEAFDNATIQPAGPRSGTSGKNFFNIEGSDNGNFASYGVARFDATAIKSALDTSFGAGQWLIDTIHLQLTQSNASFTTDGPVTVYFTGDDASSIQPGASLGHPFAGDFPGAASIMSYNFAEVSTGTQESHLLWSRNGNNSSGGDALKSDLLGDTTITLALVDSSSSVAATYAGFSNASHAGPTLTVIAAPVPEPKAIALMLAGLGLIGLLRRRLLGRR